VPPGHGAFGQGQEVAADPFLGRPQLQVLGMPDLAPELSRPACQRSEAERVIRRNRLAERVGLDHGVPRPGRLPAALLHGSADRSHRPPSRPNSGDTDGDRASQLQHAVQDMDGDTNLGGTTLVLMKAQTVPDHLFVASDGDLHPAASG
jgi:hypothetical protein